MEKGYGFVPLRNFRKLLGVHELTTVHTVYQLGSQNVPSHSYYSCFPAGAELLFGMTTVNDTSLQVGKKTETVTRKPTQFERLQAGEDRTLVQRVLCNMSQHCESV